MSGFGASSFGTSGFGAAANSGGGFGGFGSNNNTNTGFGAPAQPAAGFGAPAQPTSGFGQPSTNAFGSNTTSTWGQPATPASGFGAPTNTTSSFGGGFGSTNNTTSNAFGASTTTGANMFGQQNNQARPMFGQPATTTGANMFGQQSNTGFGSNTNTTGAFGSPAQNTMNANSTECQGSANPPFAPHIEKEPSSNSTIHNQVITFAQPYQKWSLEELRTADYNAGRRFGNENGQAGAFGQTGFGTTNTNTGFGNTNTTSPFGTNNNTTGGFGTTGNTGFGQPSIFQSNTVSKPPGTFGTSSNTGFGSSTGGFGQPAQTNTGFGTNTNQSPFGNNDANKTGFGATNTGSIFGQNTGGGFGQNNNTNTGFGQNNNTNTNPFGGNNNNNQPNNTFGQTAQNTNPFGGMNNNNNNQQKSIFGQPSTTNSVFGTNTNTNNNAGGIFGNNQNNNASSIFGQKPAEQQQSNSIFGQNNNNNTGNMFGNNQNNNTNTGGIFGNNANNQNQNKSIFGQPGGNTNTGSIFGNNQQNTGNMFNGMNNNQNQQQQQQQAPQQPQQMGGSFFGNNQSPFAGSQNVLQAPQGFIASLNDQTPYGSASLFAGLPLPPQPSPGPLATPISAGNKLKKPAALPQYMLSPAGAARMMTPQGRASGYGFTYSTYGTPNSAASIASTPGLLGGSSLASSIGRSLGKSFSTTNLRRTYDGESESILSPGAFGSTGRLHATGSLKKLTIDRSLRTDLFGNGTSPSPAALPAPPAQPKENGAPERPALASANRTDSFKKRVSFDASTKDKDADKDKDRTPTEVRSSFKSTSTTDETPSRPSATSTELTVVPEEESSPPFSTTTTLKDFERVDPKLGEYQSSPSKAELLKMSKEQLKSIPNLSVWRENGGKVQFLKPVDVSFVDLKDWPSNIIEIDLRSLTVYPTIDGNMKYQKHPMGQGVNIPARITLQNSWPRSRDRVTPVYEKTGPAVEKHIARLKRVKETKFITYDRNAGVWTFEVQHFTTYGVPDDDDDESVMGQSMMDLDEDSDIESTPRSKSARKAEAGRTPARKASAVKPISDEHEESFANQGTNGFSSMATDDDTFGFRSRRPPPGAFDVPDLFMEEANHTQPSMSQKKNTSFLAPSPVIAPSDEDNESEPGDGDAVNEDDDDVFAITTTNTKLNKNVRIRDEYDSEQDQDREGEQNTVPDEKDGTPERPFFPSAVFKASARSYASPLKQGHDSDDEWEDQLVRTVSPKKRNRDDLRMSQFKSLAQIDRTLDAMKPAQPKFDSAKINTSIDLMNSLFGDEEDARTQKVGWQAMKAQGAVDLSFLAPKTTTEKADKEDVLHEHRGFTAKWAPRNVLMHSGPNLPVIDQSMLSAGQSTLSKAGEADGNGDVQFSSFAKAKDLTPELLAHLRTLSSISTKDGVPIATPKAVRIDTVAPKTQYANEHEKILWRVVSVLFDELPATATEGIPATELANYEHRIRKDLFAEVWTEACKPKARHALAHAKTPEEKAIIYLSMNQVAAACETLIEAKDFRLSTLVAQIADGNTSLQEQTRAQIDSWRKLNMLSEMSEPIRAIYELVAGNFGRCDGKNGALEDRASTFTISERFELDWMRAFGLRLWYGLKDEQVLEDAFEMYASDLDSGKEMKVPLPWFREEKRGAAWNDTTPEVRRDALWGLLRLYTDMQNDKVVPFDSYFMPENVVRNPLHHRLSFEICNVLAARVPEYHDVSRGDQLTIAFAAELESVDLQNDAIFVLLHLSNETERVNAIQKLLSRYASELDDEGTDTPFTTLTNELHVPAKWIWNAKALYARSALQDYSKEVKFLLKAEEPVAAHKVFCEHVGPDLVIARKWDALHQTLKLFQGFAETNKKEWGLGAGMYLDFIVIFGPFGTAGSRQSMHMETLTECLVHAKKGLKNMGLLQRVAIIDMADTTARFLAEYEYPEDNMDGLPCSMQARLESFLRYRTREGEPLVWVPGGQ